MKGKEKILILRKRNPKDFKYRNPCIFPFTDTLTKRVYGRIVAYLLSHDGLGDVGKRGGEGVKWKRRK